MSFTKRAPTSYPQATLVEAAGLNWLKAAEACGGPAIVPVLAAEIGLLTLKEIPTTRPSAEAAGELGTALAHMHRSLPAETPFGTLSAGHPTDQAPLFGPADNPLPMGSGQHRRWGAFHAAQRLDPVLERLRPVASAADWEVLSRACQRVRAGTFDDAESASLIHGDLWSGNVLWSPAGAVLIDPAAHAGHRESDIAMLQLFGLPHMDELLGAYQQAQPLRSGWEQRVPAHQLFYVAVHWLLFGSAYRSATVAAAQATAEL